MTEAQANGGPIEEALRTGTINALWAKLQPDAPAILSEQGNRSYAELSATANRIVRMLRSRGLAAGDSVALLCSNRPEFIEVAQATQRSGLRLTPINWHVTADEAAYVIQDCGAKAVFADTRFGEVAKDAVAGGTAPVLISVGGPVDGFDELYGAIADHSGDDLDDPSLGTTMLYTSGTTGRPKGVERASTMSGMTQRALAQLAMLREACGYQAGKDATLVTGPLYHSAPLLFTLSLPLSFGTTVVLMDGWEAEDTLRLIQEHGITHTHMVPTMFHRLLSLPDDVRAKYDLASLRVVWHGAAPCPVPVKQAVIEWLGPIVWEYYGATEGLTTIISSQEWLDRPGTVGRPDDGEIVIIDDDGNLLPAGVPGTMYTRAPEENRFRYHGDEEKTARAYNATGDYYTLGDVGYLDADGWLFLTDRSANLIISGGVNIYPAEVEAVLITHPAVGDVAVIGVPNDEWGEEVKAVVELQPDVTGSDELAEELMRHARETLAGFKVPRTVDFVDRLPREDNGKLYKRKLREEYRARAGASR
jgi:long-chain acyl-CoA synthetase